MKQNELEIKLLDHAYDIGKTLLIIFMRILTLYATIMAVFFAVVKSSVIDVSFLETLKIMCLILTGAMVVLLCVFHFFVQHSAVAYCKISEAMPENRYKNQFPKLSRMIQHVGRGLFVLCGALLGLMSLLLLKLDVVL